jgi:3-keto steroid reductase
MSCLSLPPNQSVYETTPVLNSIHSSLSKLYPSIASLQEGQEAGGVQRNPICLTLVLVCRSQAKGETTRRLLLKEHDDLLRQRAKGGVKAVDGWWEGLDIQIQTCDQSTLAGDNGVLALCQRLKAT